MEICTGFRGCDRAIVRLFAETFAASEGRQEGDLIGRLVQEILETTSDEDLRVFRAEEDGRIIGAAVFTRLRYPEDPHIVFLLSPMAVAGDHQRRGVGQALIRHALAALRAEGVQIATTYGDPNYYGRVGFKPATAEQARPPQPLTQPHGWIWQSLVGDELPVLQGPSTCVPPLDRSGLW